MTLEERLNEWLKQQPGARVTPAERTFIEHMCRAAAAGVGYGWMQQVIEWEWESKVPGGSWGPQYYEKLIAQYEERLRSAPR